MANHLFTLVTIILMAGVFGGLLNYYMQAQVDPENTNMPGSILGGLGGAALVPLILFLVSNDLMTESQGDPSKALIFAGICLIAAWASRFFLNTVTKRIVQETHTARLRTDELMIELRMLQRELEPMLEMETEGEEESEILPLPPEEELDVTTANVLTALGNGRYIFRSQAGLARETNLDEHTLSKTLGIIVARDLGGKILSKKGTRWFISQKGRNYLAASS
ncbi:YEATS-associated helix-containing protein [Reinekea sp. G2M2-21]|uniref:YEATS-associated helix-containing protein n=1 Tax=Reinekea sp. G2M2-21 TaxID=2788942 RepID=UPI0018AA38F3|nr:YEATS-associated helix-containing protein [Reinekea sp. G2M2-21]